MKRWISCLLVVLMLVLLMPSVALAETVTVPFGTVVYCELEERVTSKKKETSKGDLVRARVWRDVWVDGHLVIKAGTAIFTRVAEVKKSKMAGRQGSLELETLNVVAVDGRDVTLDGGYDKSGRGKMGLTIALAAVVAWPLVFMKGKQAILEPGTLFDAIVRNAVEIEVTEAAAGRLTMTPDLLVTVLYDEMDPEKKITDLPLLLEVASGEIESAAVVEVNGEEIQPIALHSLKPEDDGTVRGLIDFKKLSKQFQPGMNRFAVKAGEHTAEVLLEIEL